MSCILREGGSDLSTKRNRCCSVRSSSPTKEQSAPRALHALHLHVTCLLHIRLAPDAEPVAGVVCLVGKLARMVHDSGTHCIQPPQDIKHDDQSKPDAKTQEPVLLFCTHGVGTPRPACQRTNREKLFRNLPGAPRCPPRVAGTIFRPSQPILPHSIYQYEKKSIATGLMISGGGRGDGGHRLTACRAE